MMKSFATALFLSLGLAAQAATGSLPTPDWTRPTFVRIYFAPANAALPAAGAPATAVTASSYGVGGGIEQILVNGIGAAADLTWQRPSASATPRNVGILDIGGTVHPLQFSQAAQPLIRTRKPDLFLTAGYTDFIKSDKGNGYFVGAGLNWWFRSRMGVLTELRFQRHNGASGQVAPSFTEVRLGLVWR